MNWLRALWARVAIVGVGRKAPLTVTEQKAKAWGGVAKGYRQTQPAHAWKLRTVRRDRTRRRA